MNSARGICHELNNPTRIKSQNHGNMFVDDSPPQETSQTQPEGPGLKKLPLTPWGFMRWQSLRILLLAVFLVMYWLVLETVPEMHLAQTLVLFILSVLIFVMLVWTVQLVDCIDLAIFLPRSFSCVEKGFRDLGELEFPSPAMLGSLSILQTWLLRYSKGLKHVLRRSETYQQELQHQIRLFFSCVSEALNKRDYSIGAKKEDFTGEGAPKPFDPHLISSWMGQLRTHLVGTRKLFAYSSRELTTLKYLFEEWLNYLKDEYTQVYNYSNSHLEEYEKLRLRKRLSYSDALKGVTIAAIAAIMGAMAARLLGS